MWFYLFLYSICFTRFCVGLGNTVNFGALAPRSKHEKTQWFHADYQLFCMLDEFLICLFAYFSIVKRKYSNHSKIHMFYHRKLGAAIILSSSTMELHFAYQIYTFHGDLLLFGGVMQK